MRHRLRWVLSGLVVAGLVLTALPLAVLTAALGSGQTSCGSSAGLVVEAGTEVVGASEYGGTGDPGTPGDSGAYGSLSGHYAFAELSTNWAAPSGWDFSALGGLAPHSLLQISYRGRSVIAEKLDVGRGGPPVGRPPTARAVDLWWETADALGFSGTGLVTLSPVPPGTPAALALDGGASATARAAALAGGCLPTTFAGASSIVSVANSQVGTGELPPGSGCTPYGRCEEWCALFATWVWAQAGVPIPSMASTSAVYEWARVHGRILSPASLPAPGDALFFGSGPASSLHMGIVTAVLADGRIVEVDGNYAHRVSRVGPYRPGQAAATTPGQGGSEPGPIYAYAQPVP